MKKFFPSIKKSKVSELVPYVNNARTHDDAQVAQVAASIKEFGFTNPILLDGDRGVIAGHGRLLAAQKLGLKEVPTIELAHLSEAQKKAYIIADNKLALNAGWDQDILQLELEELKVADFDLGLTGFSGDELAGLFGHREVEGNTDPDEIPEVSEEPTCVLGDVWELGRHRLMCGDSTSIDNIHNLIGSEVIDLLLTDPPYGINYGGMLKGKGDGKGGADKNGWKSHDAPEWDKVRPDKDVFTQMLTLGANSIIWGGNYFADLTPPTMGWLIWDKGQRDFSLADGEMAWTSFNNALRIKSYARASANKEEKFHPTQKPVEIMEWCLEYADRHSKKSVNNVLDVYLGSGTTLLTCEKVGKKCYGMELDPHYCDVTIKRWEDFTGLKAKRIEA